jgi:hypothetical protein
VRYSSIDPAITIDDDAASDFPLTWIDAVVTDRVPNATLVTAAANQCVERLTRSGHPSTLDGCIEDYDDDLVADPDDNCVATPNAIQLDADGDGHGNACDADLDGDGVVGASDVPPLAAAFGASESEPAWNPAADLDGDGTVGLADFALLRGTFGLAPGESGFPGDGAQGDLLPRVEILFAETGTSAIATTPGATVTAQIWITPGPEGLAGYAVSLRFDADLDFADASELVPAGFERNLSFGLETVTESDGPAFGDVRSCEAVAIGAGAPGVPFLACEIELVASDALALDGVDVFAGLFAAGVDGLLASDGSDVSGAAVFTHGSVHLAPEAARVLSIAAALGALAALRRGRS